MSNSEFNNLSDEDSDFDPDNEDTNDWPQNQRNDEEDDNNESSEEEGSEDSNSASSNVLSKLTRTCIREILEIVEQSENVNYKSTLEINLEMQSRLRMIKQQIEMLYHKVKKRYSQNEQRLLENLKVKKGHKAGNVFGKHCRGERFFIKGNTYFKDHNDRFCPNNEDYFRRRQNGEVFPMDFDLVSRHIWSIADKMAIVKGIKEQMLCEKSLGWLKKHGKEKLAKMLEEVGDDFHINWTQVSSYYIRHRHSPTSCKAMWEVYLHPALKHNAFTQAENKILMSAAQRFELQDWVRIAAEVGQRSDYQCFLQYHTSSYFRNRADRWDKKDDIRLLEIIEKSRCNGVINWNQVAFHFPQKPKTSIQQRYQYAINPSISHERFCLDEDLLLFAAVQEYGTNFGKFPTSLFPNRSSAQLRARYWNTLQNCHKKSMWTLQDDKLLMSFVEEHGESSWKKCADFFENRHNRISCRQRYNVIKGHLQKNENATLEQMPRRSPRITRFVTDKNWQEVVEKLRSNPNATLEMNSKPHKRKRRKPPVKENKLDNNISQAEDSITTDDEPSKKVQKKSKQYIKPIPELETYLNSYAVPSTSKEVLKFDELAPTNPMLPSMSVSADSVTLVYDTADLRTTPDAVANFIYHTYDKEPKIPTVRQVCVVKREEKKVKKDFVYIDRLRGFGLKYHNLLKFSYDFWFCRQIRNTAAATSFYTRDAKSVKSCLGLAIPQLPRPMQTYSDVHINGLYMPSRRSRALTKFARDGIAKGTTQEPDGSLIQPNFSTLVAFRALCALMGDMENKKKEEFEEMVNPTRTEEQEKPIKKGLPNEMLLNLPVMQRFRQRFRAMFYQTVVLSRLPTENFDNKQIQEPEEYHPETPTPIENGEFEINDVASTSSECNFSNSGEVFNVKSELPNETETFEPPFKCKEEPEFFEEFY